MNILLFGAPGAGKGTQSALLASGRQMRHISTGDLFRAAIKEKTPLGVEAKGYLDAGKLVPDSITIGLVKEVFGSLKGQDFILDGFPRTIPQAEALESVVNQSDLKAGKAIFIDIPQSILVKRLTGRRVCQSCAAVYHIESSPTKVEGKCDKCGGPVVQRSDDKEDVIRTRLEAYENNTAPLREFYRKKGRLVEVDGTGEVNEVYQRILKVMA